MARKTANQKIYDEAVRRAIHIEKVKNGLSAETAKFLNEEVLPALRKRLEKGAGKERTKKTVEALDTILSEDLTKLRQIISTNFADLAQDEVRWLERVVKRSAPVDLEYGRLGLKTLERLKNPVFEGGSFNGYVKGIQKAWTKELDRTLRFGLIAGDPPSKIVKDAMGTSDLPKAQLNSLVRTASNHVATTARVESLKENDDVVKGMQVVAVLDARTTRICAARNGSIIPVDSKDVPPYHWNCRTTLVPVLKSWKELGLNFNEIGPGERASMDGSVPENTDYATWLKSQPASVQDEILGKKNGAAYRKGKYSVEEFLSKDVPASKVTKPDQPV